MRVSVLALGVLWLGFSPGSQAASKAKNEETEFKLQPFTLKTIDGKEFQSKREFSKKTVVISFWRLEQDHSMDLLGDLAELRSEFSKDVLFVAILSGKENPSQAQAVIKEKGISFPVLLDPEMEVYADAGVIVRPTTLFLDLSQKGRFRYPGHRRDFQVVTRANLDYLQKKITKEEREQRLAKSGAPRAKGTLGGKIRYRLALKLLADGKREAAKEQLQEAMEADPPAPEAAADLSLLLLEDGDEKGAQEVLEKALKALPDDPRVIGAMGVVLSRKGDKKAKSFLKKAIEGGAEDPIFYYELGKLTEKKSEKTAAGYYRKGLEMMLERSRIRRDNE